VPQIKLQLLSGSPHQDTVWHERHRLKSLTKLSSLAERLAIKPNPIQRESKRTKYFKMKS